MKFRESLFEQYDPKLVAVSVRETRFTIVAGDVVINDDFFPFTILANFYSVDSIVVLLVLNKNICFFRQCRAFCDHMNAKVQKLFGDSFAEVFNTLAWKYIWRGNAAGCGR
jgi:hypothetical protein